MCSVRWRIGVLSGSTGHVVIAGLTMPDEQSEGYQATRVRGIARGETRPGILPRHSGSASIEVA